MGNELNPTKRKQAQLRAGGAAANQPTDNAPSSTLSEAILTPEQLWHKYQTEPAPLEWEARCRRDLDLLVEIRNAYSHIVRANGGETEIMTPTLMSKILAKCDVQYRLHQTGRGENSADGAHQNLWNWNKNKGRPRYPKYRGTKVEDNVNPLERKQAQPRAGRAAANQPTDGQRSRTLTAVELSAQQFWDRQTEESKLSMLAEFDRDRALLVEMQKIFPTIGHVKAVAGEPAMFVPPSLEETRAMIEAYRHARKKKVK